MSRPGTPITGWRDAALLVLRGAAMGVAEVVPGVSGGTIAFITGIYERLVTAIQSVQPMLWTVLRRHGVRGLWHAMDATFLVLLMTGMGLAVLAFSGLIAELMAHRPIQLWSFFFGLIIASAVLIGRQVAYWTPVIGIALGMGTALGVILTRVTPLQLEPSPAAAFVGGAIAICAWILPGVSGSFVLLLLGLYGYVLDAVRNLDLPVLAALAAGCGLGLLAFARVLVFLLRRHRDATLAALTGLMLGALSRVWPWKQTLSYQIDRHGEQIPVIEAPVLPTTWARLSGEDPALAAALLCALFGVVTVIGLQRLGRGSNVE